MMKRFNKFAFLILFLVLISVNTLFAENILKILEGYGRDSISTFSQRSAHSEAARLFNLILEPNGKITAEKAEDYLSTAKSSQIRAYLSLMLADYAFVNKEQDSGLRYMKRAVEEHDPIRNDSYYRAVLDRAQKSIKESPGKEQGKTSILAAFDPPPIMEEPAVKEPEPPKESAPTIKELTEEPVSEKGGEFTANFRIQVGAYSSQDNAERIKNIFIERGYAVVIDKRERSNGYLYLVRIGAYTSYDEAKNALTQFRDKYPAEDGIVIKVEK